MIVNTQKVCSNTHIFPKINIHSKHSLYITSNFDWESKYKEALSLK